MKTQNTIKTLAGAALAVFLTIGTVCAQEGGTTTTTTTTTGDAGGSGSSAETGSSLEIGARYMPTFSSFNLRQPDGSSLSADFELGHGFGGLVGFNFTQNVGLQGELIYTTLAQKYQSQQGERRINLDYVNIPLLLSLNTGRYRAVNLNIVAGPQFGINVGGKAESTQTGDGEQVRTIVSAKAGDIGVAWGAGLDFGLGAERRTRLGIGFRGVYGLIDVSDNSNTNVTGDYYILDRTHIETYAGYIGLAYLIK